MAGKTRYKKNLIPGRKEDIVVYATPRLSQALREVTDDMTFYKGVRLIEILEAVYKQGTKDGARQAFETTEKKLREAQKAVPHRVPGRPPRKR